MRTQQKERGVILIVGLLFLLAIILLSLAMVRSVGLQEKMAGNTLDKERSLAAAQSALEYAEWWLDGNGNGAVSVVCATPSNPVSSLKVCSNALATPATTPWPAWTSYPTAAGMNIAAGGGVATNGDIYYQAVPGLYISWIGADATPDANGVLFRVTAFSGGGSAETMSVVQSTYKLQSAARDTTLE